VDPQEISSLRLVAGDPSLDFVNTVTRRLTSHPIEFLRDFDSLLAWGVHAGLLTDAEQRAAALAGAPPRIARSVHRRALVLREALCVIFDACADARPLPGEALAVLERDVARAATVRRLAADGRVASWTWPTEDASLVVARVAFAAAELLTAAQTGVVRRCAGAAEGCGWLFLDESRGGRRRWCSMEMCGNRAKARAHYRRTRAG
jgi:predicted RNA-binding Zn ribbon-like protein